MVSIFSPERLAQVVTENLPPPENGKHAVVGTVDQHGAQVVAQFRFNGKWELQAAARHDWNGTNSIGAKVMLQW